MSLGWANPLSVAVTVLVAVSMTDTVLAVELAAYAVVPSGVTAIARGEPPTLMVAVTVLVVRSMADTLFAEALVT